MSAEATGWTFRNSPYRGATFAVHLAVADSANDQNDNELWATQGTVAAKARVSRKAANAALATMVADEFLDLLEDNVGKPNRYRFLYPSTEPVYDTRRPRSRPRGVTTGDNPVPSEVSPPVTGVSPQDTPPVTPGDTEPKGTQPEPKSSPSAPSSQHRRAREEVEVLDELLTRLTASQGDRLRRDPARNGLVAAAADLVATSSWTVMQLGAALTADPLDDARSIARVLRTRLDTVGDPPAPRSPDPLDLRDPQCVECSGTGVVEVRRLHNGRPEITNVLCSCVQEPAA